MEFDWRQLGNWTISGFIGLIFGIIGGYVTYRFDRRRDELNWKKEKENLEIQHAHEQALMKLQWEKDNEKLETQRRHEQVLMQQQWEHEKEKMALEWSNELKKIEFNYERERVNELRSELVRGLENPSRAIRAAIASDTMRISHIIEKVPAGGFGIVGIDQEPISGVEIDRVIINGLTCRIVSLRYNRIVDLSRDDYIIEVTGDSMNEAGIDKGDYVLFHANQHARYNHNDIVVVREIDLDIGATIKLFRNENGSPILVPMSRNPEYHSITFTDKMQILGIVTAIFKPISETSAS